VDQDRAAQLASRGRISRATLTEQLEEALRNDILDGVHPPGKRLRASELTSRYGVSATPLREALQRLAAESLVDLDPRSGAAVSEISEEDLRDIYELLAIVGEMALERSVQRGDEAWDAEVERRFRAMTAAHAREIELARDGDGDSDRRRATGDAAAAHWEFHDALYQRCGSPWLMRFAKMLHAHAERYRRLSMQTAHDRDLNAEHRAIMEAARSRDAAAAVAALRSHLDATVRLLLESFV
jgi:GntR family transcriptional regulator, carbon starvation induced regulator